MGTERNCGEMFPLQLAFILRHYCPVVKLWLLLLSLHSAMDRLYCYMDHMSVLLFIGVGSRERPPGLTSVITDIVAAIVTAVVFRGSDVQLRLSP